MRGITTRTAAALQALQCLVDVPGRVQTREIAAQTRIPAPYLAKVLHYLTQLGLVSAKRGYHGGFQLVPAVNGMPLDELVALLEGPEWSDCCDREGAGGGPPACHCPLQPLWERYQREFKRELATLHLSDLARPPSPQSREVPA